MAKQKYEEKKVIAICGRLDKTEDGDYVVTVEDKDDYTEYSLMDILQSMCGSVISLTSDIY